MSTTGTTTTQTQTFASGHSKTSPRDVWEKRISELVDQSHKHTSSYDAEFGPFTINIHPTVYSPKYFPETWWYARNIPPIVNGGSFLEVGVGSGLNTVAVAASGSTVWGVDINPDAVETTRKNLEANGLAGTVVISDLFAKVEGRFDVIFWNHPWQYDSAVPSQLRSEKTLDSEYKLLRRFVGKAEGYLTDKGVVLLGTSAYANREAIYQIAKKSGFAHKEIIRGQESIGEGVVEEYYILELKKC
ncbi:hypothetical protein PG997_014382 [Apiospora hydei]|uniref:Methyltransferase small domain-containing protein n=1 Tax=Apiospora hydei TaxID=1337664 RepID=A0ABR1UW53_9PEZI